MKWLNGMGLFALLAGSAATQSPDAGVIVLTPSRVLELARSASPEVLVGEAAFRGPRGRLSAARALLPSNPSVEILAPSDRRFDRRPGYAITVPFELGFQRARRIRLARAELERDERRVLDVRRLIGGEALGAFFEALHADRRLAIAVDRQSLAEQLGIAANERYRAGEAARIDVAVSNIELARAASEALAAEGRVVQSRAELAGILGLSSGSAIELRGDLEDRSILAVAPQGEAGVAERADVRAAESELKAASASLSLARLSVLPDLAFRLDYDREDFGGVLRRGVSLSIPIFDFGQAERGVAADRKEQARIHLSARRAAASAEVVGAERAYALALAAVERIEAVGLVAAKEAETMSEEGYRAGKLDLAALLVVRREAIDARREYVDRLLEAAIAGIHVAVAHGTLP